MFVWYIIHWWMTDFLFMVPKLRISSIKPMGPGLGGLWPNFAPSCCPHRAGMQLSSFAQRRKPGKTRLWSLSHWPRSLPCGPNMGTWVHALNTWLPESCEVGSSFKSIFQISGVEGIRCLFVHAIALAFKYFWIWSNSNWIAKHGGQAAWWWLTCWPKKGDPWIFVLFH